MPPAKRRREPAVVGGRAFASQSEFLRWAAQMLAAGSDALDEPHNQRVACDAVKMYDKVGATDAAAVVRVFAEPHPEWPHSGNCFQVAMRCGRVVTVAQKGVAQALFDPEASKARRLADTLTRNLRTAVHPQIKQFKTARELEDGSWECEACSVCIKSREQAHIDHVEEFRKLVLRFRKQEPAHDWESLQPPASWPEWHRAHASLRILCAPCNLGRPRSG